MMTMDDNLKMRIFKAANEEFREKGFQNASMRSVAARADIAVGTIYNYVENKEELFRQALRRSWQELLEEVKGLVDSPLSFASKLLKMGQLQINFMNQHRIIWYELSEAKKETHETYEDYFDHLTTIVALARHNHEIKLELTKLSDADLARLIVSMFNSLTERKHQGLDQEKMTAALEDVVAILLKGLG